MRDAGYHSMQGDTLSKILGCFLSTPITESFSAAAPSRALGSGAPIALPDWARRRRQCLEV